MKIIKESKIITEAPVDVDLHNAAIRYAKKINKPVVYGYSKKDYKFYPLTPRSYNGDDKDFRKKYKAQSIYVAYPNKSEVEIEGENNKEKREIEVLPESKKLNEAKSLENKVADEIDKIGLVAYLSNPYNGYRVEVKDEQTKEKVKKMADKLGLETKEIKHKDYTDIHIIIPEEEKKPVKEKRKPRKKVKESLAKKRINETWKGEDVIADLVDRAEGYMDDEYDIEDAINQAIDDGLIYSKDIWDLAEHYGVVEDSELLDRYYTMLYDDMYDKLKDYEVEEEAEEIEESCKKPVKESVLSEKGKQALKNRR